MSDIPPPPGGAPPPPGGGAPPPPGGAPPPGQWGQAPAPTPGAPPPGMPYGAPVQQNSTTNGLAVAALVVGILSLPFAFACGSGVLFGIVAIVLGFLGRKKANEEMAGNGAGMALAGIITGVLGLLASAAFVLFFWILADNTVDNLDDFNSDPSDGVCNEDRYFQDPDC